MKKQFGSDSQRIDIQERNQSSATGLAHIIFPAMPFLVMKKVLPNPSSAGIGSLPNRGSAVLSATHFATFAFQIFETR
ncbi:MAG: hypothetical protein AAB316_02965 [Bacteroidota bacterium]